MKKFIKPEFEKVHFEANDVIATSNCPPHDCVLICDNDCKEIVVNP